MLTVSFLIIQIVMLRKMIWDFFSFILFVAIVLFGFGAAYQGVAEPSQPFDARSIMNLLYRFVVVRVFCFFCFDLFCCCFCFLFIYAIKAFLAFLFIHLTVFRPYYQALGESFLDEYSEETGCIGPWAFTSCGTNFGWMMPYLIGIYLLITNIVLTNLLIAMFNDTVCCLSHRHLDFVIDSFSLHRSTMWSKSTRSNTGVFKTTVCFVSVPLFI